MTTAARREVSWGVWALLLLPLAAAGGFLGLLVSDPGRGQDWGSVAAGAVMAAAAFPLHIVIHEAGHLLVARLTRLRVVGVRISMTHQNAVMVQPAGPALPVRMAAFTLGGPLANLGAAGLTWQLWWRPVPTPIRVAAGVATVVGVLVGVMNLLPIRPSRSTVDSDGLLVLRWVARPRLTTAATCADPAQLDKIIETASHPLVLLTAALRRGPAGGSDRFIATAERLRDIAYDERTKPAHAGTIAAHLAVTFGTGYLHRGIVEKNPIDRANADEIIEIAELGFRRRPRDELARIGLAIARLLDHQPAQAQHVLAGLRARRPETLALATQLFAIAEIYLGDRERAAARLATVRGGNPAMDEILSALRSTDPPPELVQGGTVSRSSSP